MNTENCDPGRNKEIIKSLYLECLNNRKWGMLSDIIDENYQGPIPGTGPVAFESAVKNIIDAFPDLQFVIHDLFAEECKVVVRWEWQGTNQAAFRNFPPSGKFVTVNGIAIFEFRENKVIQSWLQNERLELLKQIGVVEF